MTITQRYEGVISIFQEMMPDPKTELCYDTPFHLLLAVILSAQCTDKRINMVTPALYARYPEPGDMAASSEEEVYSYIKSVTFPNNKAKALIKAARMIHEEYGDELPCDIDKLMRLPGVGRKTANVVASIVYDKPVIAVDTHIFRVARRIGLSKGKTPEAVEKDLERHIPEGLRPRAHHWFLLHGRYVCTARNPRCAECHLTNWCLSSSILASASSPAAPK